MIATPHEYQVFALYDLTAEVTWSKQYSANFPPTVNDYVSYEFTLENTGRLPIQDQFMWVDFVSDSGKTGVHTSFAIPDMGSGESSKLHIGPFKLREAGEHRLFIGANKQGDSALLNEVGLNYSLGQPVDVITVYAQTSNTIWLLIGISLAAGTGAGVSVLYHLRRNQHQSPDNDS
jgi:hypothetical protein